MSNLKVETRNLVSKENFKVIKVGKTLVKKVEFMEVYLSGFAILDLRNNCLVNLGDEYFSNFRTKKSASLCINDGLFEGFGHFNLTA